MAVTPGGRCVLGRARRVLPVGLGAAYAQLIERRGGGTPKHWLYRHLAFAAAGAAAVCVGAVLLHYASIKNSQLLAAYALAFILGGLVPVVQVIRVDLRRRPGWISVIGYAVPIDPESGATRPSDDDA